MKRKFSLYLSILHYKYLVLHSLYVNSFIKFNSIQIYYDDYQSYDFKVILSHNNVYESLQHSLISCLAWQNYAKLCLLKT